jgi:hypothetical protein
MRAMTLATVLLLVGCTQGDGTEYAEPVHECEEDMGNCRTPQERYVQIGWQDATSNSGFHVANRNGCEMIALGSQDTSGGVIIVPAMNNGTGLKQIVVTPEAPFIGWIEGPFQVLPIYTGVPVITAGLLPVLDLLVYETQPPWFSNKRAPVYWSNLYTTLASAFSFVLPTRGRRLIEVSVTEAGYPSTDTWTLTATHYGVAFQGQSGVVASGATLDTRAYATPAAAFRATFNDINGLSAVPGSPRFDRLTVANAGTGAVQAAVVVVQMWD